MGSIAGRLLAWFLALALVPLAVLGVVTTRMSTDALQDSVRDNLIKVAAAKAAELERYADSGHWIDVRDPHEFAEGHIPGARNFPLSELGLHLAELRANDAVVLSCRSGVRSVTAARMAGRSAPQSRAGTVTTRPPALTASVVKMANANSATTTASPGFRNARATSCSTSFEPLPSTS